MNLFSFCSSEYNTVYYLGEVFKNYEVLTQLLRSNMQAGAKVSASFQISLMHTDIRVPLP